ncbi:MAG: hypothetical protein PWP23_339 [Candidatus Sumerlaeota bacterium]|nr:hypothetical protein [Candidatus Sumerlaeota bacterium]
MAEKKKILCVDDEMDVLLILKTALSEDYEVVTAGNGIDALALVDDHKPDLVILDMMMPEMDGLQTLKELRQTNAGAHIPVLFLTGVSDKDIKREALGLGTSYYLTKPFDYNDLISKVEIAIKEASSMFP